MAEGGQGLPLPAPGERAAPRLAQGIAGSQTEGAFPSPSPSFPFPRLAASSSSDAAGGWQQQQPWVGRAMGWVLGTFVSVPGSVADVLWVPRQLLHPPAPCPVYLPTENSRGEMGTREIDPAWHGKPAGDLMEDAAPGLAMCILIDFFFFFFPNKVHFLQALYLYPCVNTPVDGLQHHDGSRMETGSAGGLQAAAAVRPPSG